jgi:cation transport regulator ChaC
MIRDGLTERILARISREELDRHAEKLANRETDPYTLVDQLLEQSGFGKTTR